MIVTMIMHIIKKLIREWSFIGKELLLLINKNKRSDNNYMKWTIKQHQIIIKD